MKLQSAFKLSALAVALASTSVAFAATLNTSELGNDVWTDPRGPQVGNVDQSNYQYVDVGSKVVSQTGAGTVSKNTLVESHEVSTGVYVYKIDGRAYTIGANNTLEAYDEANGALTSDTFRFGGTANNLKAGDIITTAVIARTDTNQVKYGETVTKDTANLSVDLAVTDSQGVTQALGSYKDNSPATGPSITSEKSVELGIVAKNADGSNQYGVKATDGSNSTTLDANGIRTTGNISAGSITLNGKDLAQTIADGDATTLTSANGYTDTTAQALRDEAATESARVNQAIANGDAATLASANGYTDTTAQALRDEAVTESARVNQAIADGDAATLASANAYTDAAESRLNQAIVDGDAATLASANAHTDTTAQKLRDEAATESARVNQAIADGDAATLASANNHTDATAQALRNEVATESARVDQAIASGDAATLASANTHTDATAQALRSEAATESARVDQAIADGDAATLAAANTNIAASEGRLNQAITDGDAATLASANAFTNTAVSNITASTNAYTDTKATETLASANAYTDAQVSGVNTRVNQLNKRIDDVEKTSYRGIAIALAAQQQIPNIGAGQVAVFGGAGHYEGESAAALGLASVLADGRTAFSAALGFAGGNEVGGRVGVSYVFGGK